MNRRGNRLFNPLWNAATVQPRPAVPTSLVDLLASLRAAYLTYRNAHWQVRGTGYYGNHLLLQRIYEEAAEHVDTVAERIVGYYGPAAVDLEGAQAQKIKQFADRFSKAGDPIEQSLTAAEAVRDALKTAYDDLKRSGSMSLGMDDMLMSISSDKDEHIYLLQQALEGHEVKVVDRKENPRKRRLLRW